jgi:hypothetical protein
VDVTYLDPKFNDLALLVTRASMSDKDVQKHSDITYFNDLLEELWRLALRMEKPLPTVFSDELRELAGYIKKVKP